MLISYEKMVNWVIAIFLFLPNFTYAFTFCVRNYVEAPLFVTFPCSISPPAEVAPKGRVFINAGCSRGIFSVEYSDKRGVTHRCEADFNTPNSYSVSARGRECEIRRIHWC